MIVGMLVIGMILAAAAINNSVPQLGQQVNQDLFGGGGGHGFLVWLGAILVISAFFRMISWPEAGKAFMALVIIAMLLSDERLPQQILQEIQSIRAPSGGAGTGSGAVQPAPGRSTGSGFNPLSLLGGLTGSGGGLNIGSILGGLFGGGSGSSSSSG